MPATIPTKEHGGSINPRQKMRKHEFRQLNRIQGKLERRWKTAEFNDEQLEKISIVRGAPFDIDEDDPIDLDPRFFLPGPVEDMEYGLEVTGKAEGLDRCRWPQAEPIELHLLRDGDERRCRNAADEAYEDAKSRGIVCTRIAKEVSGWQCHRSVYASKMPYCYRVRPSEDGRPRWHNWCSGEYFMWSQGPLDPSYHPNVPHAVATVYDMSPPRHQGLLHSELLVAVGLLKAQIRRVDRYLDHHVYPVLVVSFHARFSARVVQAYFENGRIVVRTSRLVNLHTRVISPDVRLLIRWLNSRPVGDTRLPISDYKPVEDDLSLPVEATDLKGVLSPMIST